MSLKIQNQNQMKIKKNKNWNTEIRFKATQNLKQEEKYKTMCGHILNRKFNREHLLSKTLQQREY